MRKAAKVRNTQVTLSGKTPMEIAMERRPADLLDPASMNPEQLTSTPTNQDLLSGLGIWRFIRCRGAYTPHCISDTNCSSNTNSRDSTVLTTTTRPHFPTGHVSSRMLPGVLRINRVSAEIHGRTRICQRVPHTASKGSN